MRCGICGARNDGFAARVQFGEQLGKWLGEIVNENLAVGQNEKFGVKF